MKNILVVGGAGYIGSVLIRHLLAREYAVRVLDLLYFGNGLLGSPHQVELVTGDMRLIDASVMKGIDTVINLGGLSNDPTAEYNPGANFELNAAASHRIAVLAKSAGVARYVLASTCSIYDASAAARDDALCSEDAEVEPRAAYPGSKYVAERLLLELADASFCPVIFRMGTVCGFSPRMRYDLVLNTFVKDMLSKRKIVLHGGGEVWRPLIDVRDVASAYAAVIEAADEKVRGQVINIASGNFRVSELAVRAKEALRRSIPGVDIRADYAANRLRSYRVCTRKSVSLLGFVPQITLEQSATEMVHSIREHGCTDFDNPRYYNITWMQLREADQPVLGATSAALDPPLPTEPDALMELAKCYTWGPALSERRQTPGGRAIPTTFQRSGP